MFCQWKKERKCSGKGLRFGEAVVELRRLRSGRQLAAVTLLLYFLSAFWLLLHRDEGLAFWFCFCRDEGLEAADGGHEQVASSRFLAEIGQGKADGGDWCVVPVGQNGLRYWLNPFSSLGPVQPIQSTGPGQVQKH
ncbi:hypothetical protein SLEP1_g32909 [Rubroshorea leprosula]|uniref:Uncharacterized protein n=1 Tax=Rubroshorea leprosula TaxID=152421 RepID=A0AAV5KEX8_9ROSI|nr:hypothetical protein SLEP1_g32909 [Rubroshorea leprosula]